MSRINFDIMGRSVLVPRVHPVLLLVDAITSGNRRAAKLALQHMRAKGARLTDTRTLLGSSTPRLAKIWSYTNF